jgi:hypothetical protein
VNHILAIVEDACGYNAKDITEAREILAETKLKLQAIATRANARCSASPACDAIDDAAYALDAIDTDLSIAAAAVDAIENDIYLMYEVK